MFHLLARNLSVAAATAGIGALFLLPHEPVLVAMAIGTLALGGVLYILVG